MCVFMCVYVCLCLSVGESDGIHVFVGARKHS